MSTLKSLRGSLKGYNPLKPRFIRRGKLHDEWLSTLAARTLDFPPFKDAPKRSVYLANFLRDRMGDKFTYLVSYPDGTVSVRTEMLGRKIHFGYFKPENTFSAARYADMVAVRVWKFKHREAIPPHASKLNFNSHELAEDDWNDYSDTYGANITDVLDRLQELGLLKENEIVTPPRKASELIMDSAAEANRKLDEMAIQLKAQESLIQDLGKKLDALADRLTAGNLPAPLPNTLPPYIGDAPLAPVVTCDNVTRNPQDAWA